MTGKILTILATLLAIPFAGNAQMNVSAFRNDSLLSNFRIYNGESIRHVGADEDVALEVNDFITGQTRIPVKSIDSLAVHQTDIPVLRFTLPDYPDAPTLWEKELYVDANLAVEGFGYCDDQPDLSLQIKGRGNTTWGMPKKPIRLKFKKKTSLCGFKKAKSFVLLNNYVDPSLMRNALALWLAKRLGVPYSNTIVPCHVFINGNYAGAYTLTEKVGINSGSVDIDETAGILFELDVAYDEKYKFKSELLEMPVMVKDPDFDELYEEDPEGPSPEERLAMWQADFNHAEQLIEEGRGAEVFDLESVVNYVIVNYLMGNPELFWPKSFYIHKKSLGEGEKYFLGPCWDFDVSCNFKQPTTNGLVTQSPTCHTNIPQLLATIVDSEEFVEKYMERVQALENEIWPEFMEYFENYASLIEMSGRLNGMRWPETHDNFGWIHVEPSTDRATQVEELRDWLQARYEHIKTVPPHY